MVEARTLRADRRALDKSYGAPIFEFLTHHPEEGRIFQDAMTALSMIDRPTVAAAYGCDGIHSIVDVGGGHGPLLATILARTPHVRGTLYEVQHVVAGWNFRAT